MILISLVVNFNGLNRTDDAVKGCRIGKITGLDGNFIQNMLYVFSVAGGRAADKSVNLIVFR